MEKKKNVKEESITDWLLYKLSSMDSRFYYKAFTRNEEAQTTGADWEWWVVFHNVCYRFRIQAKKMNDESKTKQSLGYKKGKQLQFLLRDAQNHNALPMYVLYSKNPNFITKCNSRITDEGAFICSANFIKDNYLLRVKPKTLFDKVANASLPLSCLINCPLVTNEKDLESFISEYHLVGSQDSQLRNKVGRYKIENIPNYLGMFLRSDSGEIDESQFEELKELKAILISDFRKPENQ